MTDKDEQRKRPPLASPAETAEKLIRLLRDSAEGPDARRTERASDLAAELVDFVLKLETLIAGVWGKVAPRSSMRRGRGLGESMLRFLTENGGAQEGADLKRALSHLQQYTTALLTGISRAGEEFGRTCVDRFNPESILGLTKMEQGGLRDSLVNEEVKCWRKYKELADSLTPEHIQSDIENAVGNYAEAFVKGLERIHEERDRL
jgi:hypothetical protein